ncbi:hypothetical protein K435DRAFT_423549 [Dendrothele bispora CBS 962.96]|uniref:MARVEL domain-containing protein n=1 Tax=Dendrothele bispora (strain CBS 962.96) TaxID=1314807 RepID=A0A4S8L5I5_DENBC|nr:hypothetical protein K435DRAFT_423549 [Dendrothele bispora CBS 962.96]
MAFESHVKRGHPITFGLMIIFGIIELALSAWLTSRFNARHDYSSLTERDRVRFVLFACCWTIVLGFFYGILFWHSASGSVLTSVASHLLFLILTWIIWTAAAVSVTEMLGGGLNCKTQAIFNYCSQLNALEAFAWLEWLLTTFALIVVIIRGIKAARGGDGYRGSLA